MRRARGWVVVVGLCVAGAVMAQGRRAVRGRRARTAKPKAKVVRGVSKATAAKFKHILARIRPAHLKKRIAEADRKAEQMHKALAAERRAFSAALRKEPAFPAFRKRFEQIVESIKRDVQAAKRSAKSAPAKEKAIAGKIRALSKLKKQNEPMLARAYAKVRISKKKLAELARNYLGASGRMILDPTGLAVAWAAPADEELPQTEFDLAPPFTDSRIEDYSHFPTFTSAIADKTTGLVYVSSTSVSIGRANVSPAMIEYITVPSGYRMRGVECQVRLDSYSVSTDTVGLLPAHAHLWVGADVWTDDGTCVSSASEKVAGSSAFQLASESTSGSGTYRIWADMRPDQEDTAREYMVVVEVHAQTTGGSLGVGAASADGFVKSIRTGLSELR